MALLSYVALRGRGHTLRCIGPPACGSFNSKLFEMPPDLDVCLWRLPLEVRPFFLFFCGLELIQLIAVHAGLLKALELYGGCWKFQPLDCVVARMRPEPTSQ